MATLGSHTSCHHLIHKPQRSSEGYLAHIKLGFNNEHLEEKDDGLGTYGFSSSSPGTTHVPKFPFPFFETEVKASNNLYDLMHVGLESSRVLGS